MIALAKTSTRPVQFTWRRPNTMSTTIRPISRVLVIGAGPAGLATAACLKQANIKADLIDRSGLAGGAYAHLHGGITLSSPAKFTELPGLPIESSKPYLTIADYRDYLNRYSSHFNLAPEAKMVESIERVGDQFRVRLVGEAQSRLYDAVVAATGMCDHPVWPKIDGLPSGAPSAPSSPRVMHSRDWPGHAALANQRILIIGGASSAVAIAEECAEAGVKVTVSTRQTKIRFSLTRVLGIDLRRWTYPIARRLPRWLFGRRCSLRPAFPGTERGFRKHQRTGLIGVRGQVERFEGSRAIFSDGSSQEFDVVVLATGYRFKMPFLPSQVARAEGGQPLANQGESRSWPGLFFVGIPCARTVSSEFLHGMAADAPRVAERVRQRLAKLAPART